MIASHLVQGRLVPLLEDWSRTVPGIFLYHPSRRHPPMPLQVFLKFVEKWRKRSQVPNRATRTDAKEHKRQEGLHSIV
jgi:DNA-binding transcriptional LysR family regulator